MLANATIDRPQRGDLFTPKPNLRGAARMRSADVVAGSHTGANGPQARCHRELLADDNAHTPKKEAPRRTVHPHCDPTTLKMNTFPSIAPIPNNPSVSIIKFRRAKLLQDARLGRIRVEDIARALATMAGSKALADYDSGVTGGYLMKAEALLELAIECAQERRLDD